MLYLWNSLRSGTWGWVNANTVFNFWWAMPLNLYYFAGWRGREMKREILDFVDKYLSWYLDTHGCLTGEWQLLWLAYHNHNRCDNINLWLDAINVFFFFFLQCIMSDSTLHVFKTKKVTLMASRKYYVMQVMQLH